MRGAAGAIHLIPKIDDGTGSDDKRRAIPPFIFLVELILMEFSKSRQRVMLCRA